MTPTLSLVVCVPALVAIACLCLWVWADHRAECRRAEAPRYVGRAAVRHSSRGWF